MHYFKTLSMCFPSRGRSSSTDFNPTSSAALGVTCLVGVFAIVALATPWSVFDNEVEGTDVRLEVRSLGFTLKMHKRQMPLLSLH